MLLSKIQDIVILSPSVPLAVIAISTIDSLFQAILCNSFILKCDALPTLIALTFDM